MVGLLRRLKRHPFPVVAWFERVVAVPGQRGDDVQAVSASGQLGDDAGHDLARRRHVRCEVRAEDEDVHGAAAPSLET